MEDVRAFVSPLIENVERVIIGKRQAIEFIMVALLCEGHVLLEDLPGSGRTMLARSIVASLGVSPRGSLAMLKSTQALAAIRGREYVLPEDIKTLVPLTLAHRLILKPEAELRGRTAHSILEDVLEKTPLDLGTLTG